MFPLSDGPPGPLDASSSHFECMMHAMPDCDIIVTPNSLLELNYVFLDMYSCLWEAVCELAVNEEVQRDGAADCTSIGGGPYT